jgi:hypothetical protein
MFCESNFSAKSLFQKGDNAEYRPISKIAPLHCTKMDQNQFPQRTNGVEIPVHNLIEICILSTRDNCVDGKTVIIFK